MVDLIAILFILLVSFILLFVLCYFIYSYWYYKNYITHEQTSKYDKGWNKCWKCKKAESTMYFDYNEFGRIYKCKEHR